MVERGEKGITTVDGLYRSVRKVIEEGRKVVSIAANAVQYMRQFYLAFPIGHALRDELGWTHYRILMREDDPIAREWYMDECVAGGWSSRDLEMVWLIQQKIGELSRGRSRGRHCFAVANSVVCSKKMAPEGAIDRSLGDLKKFYLNL